MLVFSQYLNKKVSETLVMKFQKQLEFALKKHRPTNIPLLIFKTILNDFVVCRYVGIFVVDATA